SGVENNFGELPPTAPTGAIFADVFPPLPSIFPTPGDMSFISKAQFLGSGPGGLDNQTLVLATFVDGVYRTLLNRPADLSSLAMWLHQLQSGMSRRQLVHALWTSPEHRGIEVDQYYATFLHRAADPVGRAGFVNLFLAGAGETDVARVFLTTAEY